nr:MAG TPA: hypothetical protein [Caudoviricetes sp.]
MIETDEGNVMIKLKNIYLDRASQELELKGDKYGRY